MSYKIVFFDIDGTLTSHLDGSILQVTKDAIQQLLSNGIKVVAATGRPQSMCDEIRALGIETFISANGALATHQDRIIHKVSVPKATIHDVHQFALREQHTLSFFTDSYYVNGVKNEKILHTLGELYFLKEFPPSHPQIEEEDVCLICLFGDEVIEEKFAKQFPELTLQRWHPYVSNLLHCEVSKSNAIKTVLEHFQIDRSEAIAFGDGDNDIDMLEYVGFGIAMANGGEKVKKVADFITKPSCENGIQLALQKLGLI